MLGAFGRIVVIPDHIVMVKSASWTSKRFGANVSHLKASWDFLGDGESVDHIVVRNVGMGKRGIVFDWCEQPLVPGNSVDRYNQLSNHGNV